MRILTILNLKNNFKNKKEINFYRIDDIETITLNEK